MTFNNDRVVQHSERKQGNTITQLITYRKEY